MRKLLFVALGVAMLVACSSESGSSGPLDPAGKDASSPPSNTESSQGEDDGENDDDDDRPGKTKDAGGDANEKPGDAGADVATGTCQATLVVASMVRTAGPTTCSFIQTPTSKSGTLVYPCAGGPAKATFGSLVFEGVVTGTTIKLEKEHAFQWDDDCDWKNKQTITGDLATKALKLGYDEAPLPGQSGCDEICAGHAAVSVQ